MLVVDNIRAAGAECSAMVGIGSREMSGIWAGVRTVSPRGDLGKVTKLLGAWFAVVSGASDRAGDAMGNLNSDMTAEPLLEWPPPTPGVLGAVEVPCDRPKEFRVGGKEL